MRRECNRKHRKRRAENPFHLARSLPCGEFVEKQLARRLVQLGEKPR
jgi:hypothetical protein